VITARWHFGDAAFFSRFAAGSAAQVADQSADGVAISSFPSALGGGTKPNTETLRLPHSSGDYGVKGLLRARIASRWSDNKPSCALRLPGIPSALRNREIWNKKSRFLFA
jgi:hypothetical protein